MTFNKIKVFIVEDSEFYRTYLRKILAQDSAFEVCGEAVSGKETMQVMPDRRPDVIIMDLQLVDINKFELLEKITEAFDIPVIVVSSLQEESIRALELGASDFLPKVTGDNPGELKNFATMLQIKLKVLAGVHTKRRRRFMSKTEGNPDENEQELAEYGQGETAFHIKREPSQQLIVIAASLGGVEATLQLLRTLPQTLPGIIVVQHMPPGFTKAYAQRLDKNSHFKVKEAETGDLVEDGLVLIASGGKQLRIFHSPNGFMVKESTELPVNGFCPSADVTFASVAQVAGKKAIGIILTGIGCDGAAGLKALHDTGARTWGQNQESCAVYGMPAAAKKIGAIDEEANITGIGKKITAYFSEYKKAKRQINREEK